MNKQYQTAGLDRLYQAVQHQAEMEFMQAVKREWPLMSTTEEQSMLNYYRELQSRAEERIIIEQSRGKQG